MPRKSEAVILGSAFLIIASIAQATSASDQQSEAVEGFRKEAQTCKTSSNQEVTFDLKSVLAKPVSEAASPEEEARIKDLLAKSHMPYDKKEHRATYEFVLGMIRTKNIAVFHVASTDKSEDLEPVRKCLGEMATASGLEFRFE